MTQQQKKPDSTAPVNPCATGRGNYTAGVAAKQAQAALDNIFVAPLERLKVSDFKTKKEKLHFVADMIEKQALIKEGIGFNMRYWKDRFSPDVADRLDQTGNHCGTVACIAGWTMLLEKGVESDVRALEAADLLELSSAEKSWLFLGGPYNHMLSSFTDKQAVSVIRHLADHGEVRWDLYDSKGKRV